MSIVPRTQTPTPKFFKILRCIGIALATAGGSVLASTVALPAIVLTIAGYVTVAGSVMIAVSQAMVEYDKQNAEEKE